MYPLKIKEKPENYLEKKTIQTKNITMKSMNIWRKNKRKTGLDLIK